MFNYEGTLAVSSVESDDWRTDFVEVERERSWNGAVETRLEERRPRVAQHASATDVAFTHSSDARMYHLHRVDKQQVSR